MLIKIQYNYLGQGEYVMEEFNYIIKDLLENDKVNEMKIYKQHCNTSCYCS